MSYEQKLMAMKKMIKKKPQQQNEKPTFIVPPSPNYEARWLAAGLVKEQNHFGTVYKKVIRYPKNYRHGNLILNQLSEAIQKWQQFDEPHPLAPVADSRLLFFDTETTGLKGAGALIFLLGLMEEKEDCFEMTQYVLPNPDHEAAFLYATKLWEKEVTLVSYNGKSFDTPQLQSRWTMNRHELPKLLEHYQIDLLHGARRVWKETVESFKLTKIEESQLAFYRKDDIPGHLAPVIYQDAVKSGNPDHLMKVLVHNEWDILSLVTLFIRATHLILEKDVLVSAIPHTNIGKWFFDLKFYENSKEIFETVIAKYGANHPITHYHYAFILKKNDRYEEAFTSFEIVSNQLVGRERIIALEEMAKIAEHRLKDAQLAYTFTEKALEILHVDEACTRKFRRRKYADFKHRQTRLNKKMAQ